MARKKTKTNLSEADQKNIRQAIVLAHALKSIDRAYDEMDAVFFNPSSYLETQEEIRNKIVDLLQQMDLGACPR